VVLNNCVSLFYFSVLFSTVNYQYSTSLIMKHMVSYDVNNCKGCDSIDSTVIVLGVEH
jgi:hypothetical protein